MFPRANPGSLILFNMGRLWYVSLRSMTDLFCRHANYDKNDQSRGSKRTTSTYISDTTAEIRRKAGSNCFCRVIQDRVSSTPGLQNRRLDQARSLGQCRNRKRVEGTSRLPMQQYFVLPTPCQHLMIQDEKTSHLYGPDRHRKKLYSVEPIQGRGVYPVYHGFPQLPHCRGT